MHASVSVLDREMYSEADAARLLRVPRGTLHYRLEGKSLRRPSVKGISTAMLKEYSDDRYNYDEIATEFNLDLREVELAIAYELQTKTA